MAADMLFVSSWSHSSGESVTGFPKIETSEHASSRAVMPCPNWRRYDRGSVAASLGSGLETV